MNTVGHWEAGRLLLLALPSQLTNTHEAQILHDALTKLN